MAHRSGSVRVSEEAEAVYALMLKTSVMSEDGLEAMLFSPIGVKGAQEARRKDRAVRDQRRKLRKDLYSM